MIEKCRRNWANEFEKHGAATELSWGDPCRIDEPLGNYRFISEWLQCATYNADVVDIGTFTGKWIEYMQKARSIMCVDIIWTAMPFVRKRYPHLTLDFYMTMGDELHGLPDNSFDIIFSMDSLMRAPEGAIRYYIDEAYRVLRPGGRTFIHLPSVHNEVSRFKKFTEFDPYSLKTQGPKWTAMWIDTRVVNHGVILRCVK